MATKKNIVFLTQSDNTDAIEFVGSNRYKKKVEGFIKELLQRRDKYLVDKYSSLNEYLPYNQQYNNLVWLYDLNLLTKEELNRKINELEKIEFRTDGLKNNSIKNIIGFKNYYRDNEPDDENIDE